MDGKIKQIHKSLKISKKGFPQNTLGFFDLMDIGDNVNIKSL